MSTLMFIGDSLTEFFDWQGRFPEYRVEEHGRAGETVEGLLGRVSALIAPREIPDFVFIMTGINDIAMEDYEILVTYRKVLKRVKSLFPEAKVVVQGILPVLLSWVKDAEIVKINAELRKMSAELGAEYLDVHARFIDAKGSPVPEYLLGDGVHLSAKGYEVWSRSVEDFLDAAGSSIS